MAERRRNSRYFRKTNWRHLTHKENLEFFPPKTDSDEMPTTSSNSRESDVTSSTQLVGSLTNFENSCTSGASCEATATYSRQSDYTDVKQSSIPSSRNMPYGFSMSNDLRLDSVNAEPSTGNYKQLLRREPRFERNVDLRSYEETSKNPFVSAHNIHTNTHSSVPSSHPLNPNINYLQNRGQFTNYRFNPTMIEGATFSTPQNYLEDSKRLPNLVAEPSPSRYIPDAENTNTSVTMLSQMLQNQSLSQNPIPPPLEIPNYMTLNYPFPRRRATSKFLPFMKKTQENEPTILRPPINHETEAGKTASNVQFTHEGRSAYQTREDQSQSISERNPQQIMKYNRIIDTNRPVNVLGTSVQNIPVQASLPTNTGEIVNRYIHPANLNYYNAAANFNVSGYRPVMASNFPVINYQNKLYDEVPKEARRPTDTGDNSSCHTPSQFYLWYSNSNIPFRFSFLMDRHEKSASHIMARLLSNPFSPCLMQGHSIRCPNPDVCLYAKNLLCFVCGLYLVEDEQQKHMFLCIMYANRRNVQPIITFSHSEKQGSCVICQENIFRKPIAADRAFGLLQNCNHAHCIRCAHSRWGMDFKCSIPHIKCTVCNIRSFVVAATHGIFENAGNKTAFFEHYFRTIQYFPCEFCHDGIGVCPHLKMYQTSFLTGFLACVDITRI